MKSPLANKTPLEVFDALMKAITDTHGLDPDLAPKIEEIRQALQSNAAHEWRDISTAPRDGKPHLAYNGHWMGVVVWREDDFFDERGCFIDEAGEFMLLKDFTHWQPLPTPPPPKGDTK